ncbi:MAG TPA: tetratricopeptide repeat protein [Xanthobacteraceae bacterium]|nr:tetratricopeptide repeat protein [Xanthobacteraceae bacterium]
MRISSRRTRLATGAALAALVGSLCMGLGSGVAPHGAGSGHGLLLEPALAFDGTATPATASLTPGDQLRTGTGAAVENADNTEKSKEFTALQYAADQGHPAAQWKLGRMYADGSNGVAQDDMRAFEYFSQIANSHAEEPPGTPQAHIVANAFVALGRYYLTGIPNSAIKPDSARAHQMFAYAASYFGDADAQYELGRLYLDGNPGDVHEAARWFLLAATKGQCRAEAALGDILFRGEEMPRQAARGLMWLTLGRDCVGSDEGWVKPLYDSAFRRANDDERAMALVYLKDWLNRRRD